MKKHSLYFALLAFAAFLTILAACSSGEVVPLPDTATAQDNLVDVIDRCLGNGGSPKEHDNCNEFKEKGPGPSGNSSQSTNPGTSSPGSENSSSSTKPSNPSGSTVDITYGNNFQTFAAGTYTVTTSENRGKFLCYGDDGVDKTVTYNNSNKNGTEVKNGNSGWLSQWDRASSATLVVSAGTVYCKIDW